MGFERISGGISGESLRGTEKLIKKQSKRQTSQQTPAAMHFWKTEKRRFREVLHTTWLAHRLVSQPRAYLCDLTV
jgi:hypothetical protein